MTTMQRKITPPDVTSIGKSMRVNSANAERASEGTMSMRIRPAKTSEAMAAALARPIFSE